MRNVMDVETAFNQTDREFGVTKAEVLDRGWMIVWGQVTQITPVIAADPLQGPGLGDVAGQVAWDIRSAFRGEE